MSDDGINNAKFGTLKKKCDVSAPSENRMETGVPPPHTPTKSIIPYQNFKSHLNKIYLTSRHINTKERKKMNTFQTLNQKDNIKVFMYIQIYPNNRGGGRAKIQG